MFSHMVLVKNDAMPIPCYKSVQVEGCPIADAYLHGRPVYFGEVCFDGVDSFFESASYADTGCELNEYELDQLGIICADYLVDGSIEKHGYFRK